MKIKSNSADVTLITPTGYRTEAFALCQIWMRRQTFHGTAQWIVVSDEFPFKPQQCTMGQLFIGRWPKTTDPQHTLPLNLLSAIPHIKSKKILIIEDDDWYSPDYVDTMTRRLDNAELVGEAPSLLYNLNTNRWTQTANDQHASLCQTGFRSSVIPALREVSLHCVRVNSRLIDLNLWNCWRGTRRLDTPSKPRVVGIKGVPGRKGTTFGWKKNKKGWHNDHNAVHLYGLVGDEWKLYTGLMAPSHAEEFPSSLAASLIVYTCLFGDYDNLQAVPENLPKTLFVCFSDQSFSNTKGWHVVHVPRKFDPARSTRYYKILSHKIFPTADHTLWIDANLSIRCNPEEFVSQIQSVAPKAEVVIPQHATRNCAYDEGLACVRSRKATPESIATYLSSLAERRYPRSAGLWQCSFIYRRLTSNIRKLEHLWWMEFMNGPPRDQLSLGLARHLSGVTLHTLPTLEYKSIVRRCPHRRWWNSLFDRLPCGPICGVEVDHVQGRRSKQILARRKDLMLYLVNPSGLRGEAEPINHEPGISPPSRFSERSWILTGDLATWLSRFPDANLDFVLFGNLRTFEDVSTNLKMWIPKIKSQGWLCGFNYQCERSRSSTKITMGVDAFAKAIDAVVENGAEHTWFIQAPQIAKESNRTLVDSTNKRIMPL